MQCFIERGIPMLGEQEIDQFWYQLPGDEQPHTFSQPMQVGSGDAATAEYQTRHRCVFGCSVKQKESVNRWTPTFSTKGKGPHTRIHHCDVFGNPFPGLSEVASQLKRAIALSDWQEVQKLQNTAKLISAQGQEMNKRDARILASGSPSDSQVGQYTSVNHMQNLQTYQANGKTYALVGDKLVEMVASAQPQAVVPVPQPVAAPAMQLPAPILPVAASPQAPRMEIHAQARPEKPKNEYRVLGKGQLATSDKLGFNVVRNEQKGSTYFNAGEFSSFESGRVKQSGSFSCALEAGNATDYARQVFAGLATNLRIAEQFAAQLGLDPSQVAAIKAQSGL